MDRVNFRTQILTRHIQTHQTTTTTTTDLLNTAPCVSYTPPELSEPSPNFDTTSLRKLLNGQSVEDIDYIFNLMIQSSLFCPRERGGKVFIAPDFNQSMEQQREMTMRRVDYLREKGVFDGWFDKKGPEGDLWRFSQAESVSVFDHSLGIKLAVHFFLCYV
ncbi:putative acyl-CoA oxidase [Helianthus debilis subsp. tardiflorus]